MAHDHAASPTHRVVVGVTDTGRMDLDKYLTFFRVAQDNGLKREPTASVSDDALCLCGHQARNSTDVLGRQQQGRQVPGSGVTPVACKYSTSPDSKSVRQVPQSPYSHPALIGMSC